MRRLDVPATIASRARRASPPRSQRPSTRLAPMLPPTRLPIAHPRPNRAMQVPACRSVNPSICKRGNGVGGWGPSTGRDSSEPRRLGTPTQAASPLPFPLRSDIPPGGPDAVSQADPHLKPDGEHGRGLPGHGPHDPWDGRVVRFRWAQAGMRDHVVPRIPSGPATRFSCAASRPPPPPSAHPGG